MIYATDIKLLSSQHIRRMVYKAKSQKSSAEGYCFHGVFGNCQVEEAMRI